MGGGRAGGGASPYLGGGATPAPTTDFIPGGIDWLAIRLLIREGRALTKFRAALTDLQRGVLRVARALEKAYRT